MEDQTPQVDLVSANMSIVYFDHNMATYLGSLTTWIRCHLSQVTVHQKDLWSKSEQQHSRVRFSTPYPYIYELSQSCQI